MPLAAADYSVEESFAESLGSLFAQPQVAITKAPGQTWTHESTGVVLAIPQVQEAENWSLQADAIWMASIYLADHPEIMQDSFEGTTLELGSGGGLLGIAIAKAYLHARMILSDYPDEGIIQTLRENISRNELTDRVTVLPLDWNDMATLGGKKYDRIIAADTLWNSELHRPFCQTLRTALKHGAITHIIAGMHTGRHNLQRFMDTAESSGLCIERTIEHHISGLETRTWQIERDKETKESMNHWLLYIRLLTP